VKLGFIAPRELLARKPKHGEPCTRCGICCIASLCPLAAHLFGDRPGPCPALRFDADHNSSCGLVVNPYEEDRPPDVAAAMSEAAAHLIGSGNGCDCRVNGEPGNPEFYEKLNEYDRAHKP
jgi:hypothetical protein